MKFARLSALAVAAAATAFAGSVSAVPIQAAFNFVPFGTITADTGDITTATSMSGGSPYVVSTIILNNIGLTSGQNVSLNDPLSVLLGSTFTKTFSTAMGTFVESLTVTGRTPGPTSLGISAVGTIVQTGGIGFDPTAVFYSAAYTQNAGPGGQINASFNDSTIPPPTIPEPASLALVGLALAGAALARKAKKA